MKPVVLLMILSFATAGSAADRPRPGKSPRAGGASAQLKTSLTNAKRKLRTAVELCAAPGRCDPGARGADAEYLAMLKEAEHSFMQLCEQCSTTELCDTERQRVRDGRRSAGAAPCD